METEAAHVSALLICNSFHTSCKMQKKDGVPYLSGVATEAERSLLRLTEFIDGYLFPGGDR
jgi:hypothetical protein